MPQGAVTAPLPRASIFQGRAIISKQGNEKTGGAQLVRGIFKVIWAAALASTGLGHAAHAHPMSGAEPYDSVPYRIEYQGWITVNATVNGDGPNDFIVDSGATITSVFSNLAARQSFSPAARGPIRILGLTSTQQLPAFQLGEITVGISRLEKHVGVILPDWAPPNTPPQGVLGLDLLTRYMVMVDADVNEIKFYPPETLVPKPKSSGWTRTQMTPHYIADQSTPLYRINVNVRGIQIPCVVDLGASGTVFNEPALRAMTAGIRINGWGLRGSSQASHLNDVFDNSQRAKAVKITSLKIGKARWRNETFLVYDAEIFQDLGASAKPFCLVGADLLRGRSFIFDFANERFYVGPDSN
ncbi:MAG: hypothetical protein DHS20C04_01030 [Hyphococcus sp.]|nr:MAG: hypothetical protein DHS20C04_01030 [Marinicaulis sp.]